MRKLEEKFYQTDEQNAQITREVNRQAEELNRITNGIQQEVFSKNEVKEHIEEVKKELMQQLQIISSKPLTQQFTQNGGTQNLQYGGSSASSSYPIVSSTQKIDLEKWFPRESKKTDAEVKQEEEKKLENKKKFFEELGKKRKETAKITHAAPKMSEFDDYEIYRQRMRGWRYSQSKVAEWGLIWYVCESNRDSNEDKEVSRALQKNLEKILEAGDTDITLEKFLDCLNHRWEMNKAQIIEKRERELEIFPEKVHDYDFPSEVWEELDILLDKLKALGRTKMREERLSKFLEYKKIKNNPLIGSILFQPMVSHTEDVEYVTKALKRMELNKKKFTTKIGLAKEGTKEVVRRWDSAPKPKGEEYKSKSSNRWESLAKGANYANRETIPEEKYDETEENDENWHEEQDEEEDANYASKDKENGKGAGNKVGGYSYSPKRYRCGRIGRQKLYCYARANAKGKAIAAEKGIKDSETSENKTTAKRLSCRT